MVSVGSSVPGVAGPVEDSVWTCSLVVSGSWWDAWSPSEVPVVVPASPSSWVVGRSFWGSGAFGVGHASSGSVAFPPRVASTAISVERVCAVEWDEGVARGVVPAVTSVPTTAEVGSGALGSVASFVVSVGVSAVSGSRVPFLVRSGAGRRGSSSVVGVTGRTLSSSDTISSIALSVSFPRVVGGSPVV